MNYIVLLFGMCWYIEIKSLELYKNVGYDYGLRLGEGCGYGINVVGVYYFVCGIKFGFFFFYNMFDYIEKVGVGMLL